MKILLDTNVAIELEDPKPVDPQAALLAQLCQKHNLTLHVSDPNYADVNRDRDSARRRLTQSKLEKYVRLREVALDSESDLIYRFGPIRNDNDRCDVQLLGILDKKAVDLLLSEDLGLIRRAERGHLGGKVLSIADAVDFIRRTYESHSVELPYIEEVPAYQIGIGDEFFDSLREDYPGFNEWFEEKCVSHHRSCWVIRFDGKLAGLVIRKPESQEEADCAARADKILKVSTFKLSSEFQGEKLGEQLLKQVLWWSRSNDIEVVYLTTFEKQQVLIGLLETYGFQKTRMLDDGQWILEKELKQDVLSDTSYQQDPVSFNRQIYPAYYDGPESRKFVIPILPKFYRILFPEAFQDGQLSLFKGSSTDMNRTPGNTIRKIYICRAPTTKIEAGSVILFYVTKDERRLQAQSICTVGVVERVTEASTLDELMMLTTRRSAYTRKQLEELVNYSEKPLKVIDFLLTLHLNKPIDIHTLKANGILEGPPQSITLIPEDRYSSLKDWLRE